MKTVFGLLVVAALLYVCQAQVGGEVSPIATANNRFSQDIANQVAASQDQNVIFSPFSIFSALAMTYAGAKGTTKSEMETVLHLTDTTLDLSEGSLQVPQGYKTLVDSFSLTSADSLDQHQMSIANGIWLDQNLEVLSSFISTATEYYDAEVGKVDFQGNPTGATGDINDWIANKTNNLIQDLIPAGAINEMTKSVLANAIYLKAQWASTFNNQSTSPKDFTALSKTSEGTTTTTKKVQVDMMQQINSFRISNMEGYSAIDLPYVSSSGLSMLVLVPDQAESLATFESKVWTDRAFLENTLSALQDTRVELWLPKFQFDYSFSAKDALTALGMPVAFSSNADFTGITNQANLTISDVLHKAFISVDENGTEAAAATAVLVSVTSAITEEQPVAFHVDRPFIPIIYHQPSTTILFVGRVIDPSATAATPAA